MRSWGGHLVGSSILRLNFDGGVLWLLVEREGVEEGVVQVGGQHKTTDKAEQVEEETAGRGAGHHPSTTPPPSK